MNKFSLYLEFISKFVTRVSFSPFNQRHEDRLFLAMWPSDCFEFRTPDLNYRVSHQYRKAKFNNGGSILSSNQFLPLTQMPQKTKLASKVIKIIGLLTKM